MLLFLLYIFTACLYIIQPSFAPTTSLATKPSQGCLRSTFGLPVCSAASERFYLLLLSD